MKLSSMVWAVVIAFVCSGNVHAESQPASSKYETPLKDLIAAVAKKTGKKFVVDAHVQGDVTLIGQNFDQVSYDNLNTILYLYGFSMVETGGYTLIAPDAVARQLPNPVLAERAKASDQQMVSTTIKVKSLPAGMLVPVLRPLMPMNAHLAAVPCENALIASDTFANIKRLESIVAQLDTGTERVENTCGPEKVARE